MATVEIEYTHTGNERNLRTVNLPDDIFIRKVFIRNREGEVVWKAEFDYDWLHEYLLRNRGNDDSQV